jgi:hypothetical protein
LIFHLAPSTSILSHVSFILIVVVVTVISCIREENRLNSGNTCYCSF